MNEDPSDSPGTRPPSAGPFPYRKLIGVEPEPPPVVERPETPVEPPMNRAQGCFAALLWLVPTAFAVSMVMSGAAGRLGVQLTLLAIVALTLGTGAFGALLSRTVRMAPERRRTQRFVEVMMLFFFLQVVIVPVALGAILFAMCSLSTVRL